MVSTPFIKRYFKDEVKECQGNENGTVFCSIEATAKLFEFRPVIDQALRNPIEGIDRIGTYRMVILRNPEDPSASNLANAIHAELKRYGHDVDLLDKDYKGTIGKTGNLCEQYRKGMERYRDKPNSKAYAGYKALLETCKKNKNIARSIDIISSGIETYTFDRGKIPGSLIPDMEIRNGNTGRVDQNLGSERIEDIGEGSSEKEATSDLKNRLIQRVAALILKSLNDSLAREAKDKQYKTSRPSTVEKNFLYSYTVKINGVSDSIHEDRQKTKMVRKVIEKQFATRPEKDEHYSSHLTQIYRFGTNESIYKDDLIDAFYEAAHQAGYKDFRIQVDHDGVFVVSFGG